jgi:Helix-turn-helix domain
VGRLKIGEPFNPRNTFVGLFIPEALAASTAISSTAKLAYGHLIRRAGENGRCWPSAADVAKYIGVGQRAAQRALKELQSGDHPFIRATFRYLKGRQTTNEYAFIWNPILEGVKNGSPVKNDTLSPSGTTPSGVSEMTGTTLSKTTPEKCQKKSNTGKVSNEDEATSVAPGELAELLPDWLDAEAQRRIWQGCRRFATDCSTEEVAAALQDKMRLLGKKTNPGLLITSVPKMFEGPRGFQHRFRQHTHQQAAEQERQR